MKKNTIQLKNYATNFLFLLLFFSHSSFFFSSFFLLPFLFLVTHHQSNFLNSLLFSLFFYFILLLHNVPFVALIFLTRYKITERKIIMEKNLLQNKRVKKLKKTFTSDATLESRDQLNNKTSSKALSSNSHKYNEVYRKTSLQNKLHMKIWFHQWAYKSVTKRTQS